MSALDAAKKYVTLGIEIGEEKTLEPDKDREREGRGSGDPVREAEREADRSNEPARQTGPEIVPEPKQKSVDMGSRDVAERVAFRDGTVPKPNAVA